MIWLRRLSSADEAGKLRDQGWELRGDERQWLDDFNWLVESKIHTVEGPE